MKKYNIEDITNGNCAVINNGTLEELRLIIRLANPSDSIPPGGTNLYYWLEDNTKIWRADDHTSFPVQSVKDFLNEPIKITDVKQLRVGDRIKILEKPDAWDSLLMNESPTKLKFPFTVKIKEIKQWGTNDAAMTCGSYGWSLDSIVEAGCLLLPEGVNDTTTTKIRTITSVQAQAIIKIACEGWKNILIEKWAKQIALGEDIEIEESFYKKMRTACTTAQHELFDTIFGKDEKICPYKQGELIFVKFNINNPWELRYATGIINLYGNVEVFANQQTGGNSTSVLIHALAPPNLRLPD